MDRPTKVSKSKQSKACRALLCFIDSFLSIVIFSPLVVGYWRGCWQLMDHYLLPENAYHSLWASLTIGLSSGVIFGLLQDCFTKALCRRGFSLLFLIISRIYTIIYCLCCVNHWRGVWKAWDSYTGTSWESGAASTGIGLFTLGLTRGLKNILAPPFVASPDHKEHYFFISTLFKTKRERCGFFFMDMLFTVVVTGSLVVFVWRGSWVFLDRKLFPSNPTYSAWGSLVIGVTVTILAFFAQIIMISCLRSVRKGVWKILLEDIYHTFCFLGSVNIWRGVWNLLNIYLYPDKPLLSNAMTTVGGNLILMVFFCANSTIPVKGAEMDGSKEGALGVIFKTKYLRSFFKYETKEPSCRYSYWDNEKHLSVDPSGYIDISKSNGLMDGRGMGDGNSYSDGYNGEIQSEEEKQHLEPCINDTEEASLRSSDTKDFHQTQRESFM